MNPNAPLNRPDAPKIDYDSPLHKRLAVTGPILLELEAWAEKGKSGSIKWTVGDPHTDMLLLEGRFYGPGDLNIYDWNTKIEDIEHVRGIYEMKLTCDAKGYIRFAEKPVYVGPHPIDAHMDHMLLLEPKLPEEPGKKSMFRLHHRDTEKNFIAAAEITLELPEDISNIVKDALYCELLVRFRSKQHPHIKRSTTMKVECAAGTPQETMDAVNQTVARVLKEAKPEYIGRAQLAVDAYLTTGPEKKIPTAQELIAEYDRTIGSGPTTKLPEMEDHPANAPEVEPSL